MDFHALCKKAAGFVSSLSLALGALVPMQAADLGGFEDVDENEWYAPHVSQALDAGLMVGNTETTFDPYGTLSRGMVAQIIYRMDGEPEQAYRAVFQDVSPDDWYATAVSYCQQASIISGYSSDLTFRPDQPITRQDLVKILYYWAGRARPQSLANSSDLSAYPDAASVADYAIEPMKWAVGSKIIQGNQGKLEPSLQTSRAQAAKIFTVAQNVQANQTLTPPAITTTPSTDHDEQAALQPKPDTAGPPAPVLDPIKPGEPDDSSLVANVKMYGIDISEHNGAINLEPYVGQFVIIRGGWYINTDKMFYRNVQECQRLGIPFGIYWYSYALNVQQSIDEANACLKAIEGIDVPLGVWLDMEDADHWKANNGKSDGWNTYNRETIGPISKVFCDMVHDAGYYTGVYTSLEWMKFQDGYTDPYAWWAAHWGSNNGKIHYDYSGKAVVHQYTSNPIDKNVLYVDVNALKNPQ